jgi:hypothetical protein
MNIVHSAVTPRWTFLLDAKGICRAVVPSRNESDRPVFRTLTREVHDCVGAQFVGAVDAHVPGGVAGKPRLGAPMLFAFADADGRIRLLRSGPLMSFETVGRDTTRELPRDTVRDVSREDDARSPESSGPRSVVRPTVAARALRRVGAR